MITATAIIDNPIIQLRPLLRVQEGREGGAVERCSAGETAATGATHYAVQRQVDIASMTLLAIFLISEPKLGRPGHEYGVGHSLVFH
jgi:hypothetical protein